MKALGKGLTALIPPLKKEESNIVYIHIDNITTNPYQPRKTFEESSLHELADSIKQHGLQQPLIITQISNDKYELVVGERRLRASKLAGLSTVPCIVKSLSENEKLILSLIENLQRQDLNPVEEAEGYKRLIETFNLTQEDVARMLGKNRTAITNSLRILNLPDDIKQILIEHKLTAAHARSLVVIKDEALLRDLVNRIIELNLSVREVEKIVNNYRKVKSKKVKPIPEIILNFQYELQKLFNTKVHIYYSKKNTGTVSFYFYSKSDFERLLNNFKKIAEL